MPIKHSGFSPTSTLGRFRVQARFTPAWILRIRITQEFVEVVHSGSDNRVRATQLFAELVHSGSNNKIRVTQHFVEVIHAFGTPPIIGPGNSAKAKQNSPGQQKKADAERALLLRRRGRRRADAVSRQGRFLTMPADAFVEQHVPPGDPITWREKFTPIIRS